MAKKKNNKQTMKEIESAHKKFVEMAKEFFKEWAATIHCKYINELVYFYGSTEDSDDDIKIGEFSIRIIANDCNYAPYLKLYLNESNDCTCTDEKPSEVALDTDLFNNFFYLNEILDFIVSGEFEKQLKTKLPDWGKVADLEEKMGMGIMQFRNERMERIIEDNLS